ncbi:PREDICTED: uncharacterized protein LOC107119997 [Gekko japonicus]|uniref:Uncharacterized protein LOC107119997 n=1 Tax=Gekko japonicus TaxID=146911 RepID=A0ABM1KWN2_GEKJA|nr:PREDICTED: uncharacterized protein LOC107119997 [Gekko japonicus]
MDGPVDLRRETEIQSAAVLLMSGAEKLGPAMIPERGDEVESLDPSVSPEAGKEAEKPDAVPGPSGTKSSTEKPDVFSSTQGDGVKNQDATEDANGTEKPGCSSLQQTPEVQQEAQQEEERPIKERRKALQDMLTTLNLEKNRGKKFSLQEVLEIGSESLKECTPRATEDLPWHFLRKVLALNVTARSTSLRKGTSDGQQTRKEEGEYRIDESIFCTVRMDERVSVNPLDVLCAVLLCSDSFLQQEILSKMSMCQFALPLLLPPLETSHCTLMLWAMRDIVKRWRPHSLADSRGFREESLVLTPMPTISFVRMEGLSLSKSRLLNEFLSPSQHHHDFFIHRDMEGGNIPREIADGLVEIAWYFPGGQKSSDLFPEPVAVANLHGGIESHQVQFRFLSEVSSAVFIFAECISEREYTFLSSLKELSTEYYFILESHSRKFSETSDFLKDLAQVLKLSKSHILLKAAKTNTVKIVEELRSTIRRIISADPKRVTIDDMAAVAREISIHVDEDCQECQDAHRCTLKITDDVKDVALYKKEVLKLQGDLWKTLARVEKELCRMERQGDTPSEKYRSELKGKLMLLRQQQNECDPTIGLINFIHGIEDSKSAKKYYFLKWMKFNLDYIARANLSQLRAEYKEKCKMLGNDAQKIAEVDQLISSSSLGVEHFMRELGQFYEAECLMDREGKLSKNGRQFAHIMDYDPEIHNWYIPGLWHGVPPMASVNRGYSEKVFELKKYLFQFLRDRSIKKSPKDIPQFIEWIKSLWNAVKHENFIFSFRNSLIAEAYNQLSAKYSEWDWGFRREMHLWVSEQETLIQNTSPDELDSLNWQNELQQKLLYGEQEILEGLDKYFKNGAGNLHRVEEYREDFVRSTNSLKRELESYSYNKCNDAIHIKKGRCKINTLQAEFFKVIEGKVDRLLEGCRKDERRLADEELRREFERMWTETLSEISLGPLERQQIYSDIELCLRKDLSHRGSSVNLKVQAAKSLLSYRMNTFQMKAEYINPSFLDRVKSMFSKKVHLCKAEKLAKSLMSKCMQTINEKANSRGDYHETYSGELLHIINQMLQQGEVQKHHTSPSFEVDLKLHILGEAAHVFQKLHEDFINENDPQVCLEKLKPQYFSTFTDLYLEKDAHQTRAKNFCDYYLHPALMDYVNRKLGIAIVDDILNGKQSMGYASRSFFQFTVLKELLEERNVNSYVRYIRSYEEFVKSWIMRQILGHYADKQSLKNLEKDILSVIVKKIVDMLENLKHKGVQMISEFLKLFCKEMQKELVISKDSLVGIQFKNMSDPGQFSFCVENFLPNLEKQILSDFDVLSIKSKLSKLPVKPQNEIFKRVFGCGKQCPFCQVVSHTFVSKMGAKSTS